MALRARKRQQATHVAEACAVLRGGAGGGSCRRAACGRSLACCRASIRSWSCRRAAASWWTWASSAPTTSTPTSRHGHNLIEAYSVRLLYTHFTNDHILFLAASWWTWTTPTPTSRQARTVIHTFVEVRLVRCTSRGMWEIPGHEALSASDLGCRRTSWRRGGCARPTSGSA